MRVPGHKLTMEWSGEYGVESSSTGYCPCGWSESASSQDEVRNEYHFHLLKEKAKLVAKQTGESWYDIYQRMLHGGPAMTPQQELDVASEAVREQWRRYDEANGRVPLVALIQIDQKLRRLEIERDRLSDKLSEGNE